MQIANKIRDDECVISVPTAEESEAILDEDFGKLGSTVLRYDAAVYLFSKLVIR